MDPLRGATEKVRADAPDVARLIDRHFAQMRAQSPPESCHVLPASSLDAEDIHLFALREDGRASVIGALRIDGDFGELKSMHTAAEHRGRGLARVLLRDILQEARRLDLKSVALETGSGPEHAAARSLYLSEGFAECAPFGDYIADPLSTFMSLNLK